MDANEITTAIFFNSLHTKTKITELCCDTWCVVFCFTRLRRVLYIVSAYLVFFIFLEMSTLRWLVQKNKSNNKTKTCAFLTWTLNYTTYVVVVFISCWNVFANFWIVVFGFVITCPSRTRILRLTECYECLKLLLVSLQCVYCSTSSHFFSLYVCVCKFHWTFQRVITAVNNVGSELSSCIFTDGGVLPWSTWSSTTNTTTVLVVWWHSVFSRFFSLNTLSFLSLIFLQRKSITGVNNFFF